MAPACSGRTALLLSLAFLSVFAAENLLPNPAIAVDGQEDEISRLIADGRASEQRFNADKVANRTAIIDAALAFTRAQRLLGRTMADPRRVDVQTRLYWCRKQMDVETLSAFTRRLGEPDATAAAATAKPAKAAKPTVKPAAASEMPPTPADPETPGIREQLIERTRARALALATAGQPARAQLSSTRQEAIIVGGDDRVADLRLGDAGMLLPWKLLADEDWCAIAVDLSRSHEPEDHRLAASWLDSLHRDREAEAHLIAAGR